MNERDRRRIESAVGEVKQELRRLLTHVQVKDLAFIGNASDVYEWHPSKIVDLDAFLFTQTIGPVVGASILGLRDRLTATLADVDIDFELRIVKGAYKPERDAANDPIVVAHLGIFTEETYCREAAIKRWSWRKYPCEVDATRLARLSPDRPSVGDLRDGPRGVVERLRELRARTTQMTEWTLPDLGQESFDVAADDALFAEICLSAAATSARHHARVLGAAEPDELGNSAFVEWYSRNVLDSESYCELMRRKESARAAGEQPSVHEVRALAIDYLEQLLTVLDSTR